MKIRELRMDFDAGKTTIQVWTVCETTDDCDAMIAWLHLSKANMKQWDKINAKASRAPKASAGKNEDTKQGEILSAP